MSYSDLFDSGFKDRNKGHFASIVRVALSDGPISEEEKIFLDELAIRLDISDEEYELILEDPTKFPVNPPYLQINRLERLYDLARMVYVNHVLGPKQKQVLKKFAVALGFTGNVNEIVDKALSLLVLNVDSEMFIHEMQNMGR